MKKIILLFVFILIWQYIFAQVSTATDCNYEWINNKAISVEVFPKSLITAAHPGILNLNISFDDLDKKTAIKSTTCSSAGINWAESPTAKYKLNIKTKDSAYVSFKLDANKDTLMHTFTYDKPSQKIGSTSVPIGYYQLYQYSFQVFTKPKWQIDKKKITIEYSITDLSTLPIKDKGNLVDDPVTGKWEITYNSTLICADSMISLPTNPNSTIWTTIPASVGSIPFDYAVGPDAGKDKKSDYTGVNITEELSGPFVGGFFTMADLDDTWRANNPGLITELDVIKTLINPAFGSPHMWYIINSLPIHQDKFNTSDFHGSFAVGTFQDAFKESALKDGKSGFLIKQDYKCNGVNKIGSAEIYKRYKPVLSGSSYQQNRDVKKVHKF